MRKETHVAPATANSTVLAFVNKDMQQTNAAVDTIMMANLADWLLIILQITTGASSKNTISGLKIARATLIVEEREKI
jgi:cellulase/cellobiase CelA1